MLNFLKIIFLYLILKIKEPDASVQPDFERHQLLANLGHAGKHNKKRARHYENVEEAERVING